MVMSRNKTFVATGPRLPDKSAAWRSPSSSNAPPHRQCLGMCGSGSLRRRNKTTRMHSESMRSSGAVGSPVMARGPPGPAWDNRSARSRVKVREEAFARRCVQACRGGTLPSTQKVPELPCRRCFRAGGFDQLLPWRGVKASHLQTRLCV